MNAYIRFAEMLSMYSQTFGVNQGPFLWYKYAKMTGYNDPYIDLVNINAHTKFDEILSFCS